MYINNRDKLEDTKSTSWTFTLVGGLGLLAIVLIDLNILPLQILPHMKVMLTIVMGALFFIFLVIGIKSFLSLKDIEKAANTQESTAEEVISWFMEQYADYMKDYHTEEMDLDDPDSLFFPREEKMLEILSNEYKNLSTDELDHLVERLYNLIFTSTENI